MSDEWKPCPFCGEQIEVDDLRDESFIHPFNEDCPLSNLIVWRQGKTAWNTRTPVSVQEAAKLLLAQKYDDMVPAFVEAQSVRTDVVETIIEVYLRAIAEGGEA